jgi:hypothetical protein
MAFGVAGRVSDLGRVNLLGLLQKGDDNVEARS